MSLSIRAKNFYDLEALERRLAGFYKDFIALKWEFTLGNAKAAAKRGFDEISGRLQIDLGILGDDVRSLLDNGDTRKEDTQRKYAKLRARLEDMISKTAVLKIKLEGGSDHVYRDGVHIWNVIASNVEGVMENEITAATEETDQASSENTNSSSNSFTTSEASNLPELIENYQRQKHITRKPKVVAKQRVIPQSKSRTKDSSAKIQPNVEPVTDGTGFDLVAQGAEVHATEDPKFCLDGDTIIVDTTFPKTMEGFSKSHSSQNATSSGSVERALTNKFKVTIDDSIKDRRLSQFYSASPRNLREEISIQTLRPISNAQLTKDILTATIDVETSSSTQPARLPTTSGLWEKQTTDGIDAMRNIQDRGRVGKQKKATEMAGLSNIRGGHVSPKRPADGPNVSADTSKKMISASPPDPVSLNLMAVPKLSPPRPKSSLGVLPNAILTFEAPKIHGHPATSPARKHRYSDVDMGDESTQKAKRQKTLGGKKKHVSKGKEPEDFWLPEALPQINTPFAAPK